MSQFQKRDTFIPYNVPDITDAEINEVVDTLRSGWLAKGPKTIEFEKRFADYLGAKHAVAVNSCTAALHVSLLSQDIGPGDEVITPSMTWVSIVNMIVLAGATPVFCEIDRETMLATPESIAEKITPRTKLIIPVHFAGAALDLDGIYRVAGEIPVVEDAAHALGTYYKGRHIGSTGAAIYSFHAIKNVTTGEGGMFGTEDIEEIVPAVKTAQEEGINVVGPIAPDTVFHRAANKGEFDIVVVMYHDQGHIPLKVLGFSTGVNVTVGLPCIRTSVDHGTAFEIAGKGIADPESMTVALNLGAQMANVKFKDLLNN